MSSNHAIHSKQSHKTHRHDTYCTRYTHTQSDTIIIYFSIWPINCSFFLFSRSFVIIYVCLTVWLFHQTSFTPLPSSLSLSLSPKTRPPWSQHDIPYINLRTCTPCYRYSTITIPQNLNYSSLLGFTKPDLSHACLMVDVYASIW